MVMVKFRLFHLGSWNVPFLSRVRFTRILRTFSELIWLAVIAPKYKSGLNTTRQTKHYANYRNSREFKNKFRTNKKCTISRLNNVNRAVILHCIPIAIGGIRLLFVCKILLMSGIYSISRINNDCVCLDEFSYRWQLFRSRKAHLWAFTIDEPIA